MLSKLKKSVSVLTQPNMRKGFLVFSIILGAALYLERAQIDEILAQGRMGGFLLLLLSPLYCLWVGGVIWGIAAAVRYILRPDRTWLPAIFLLSMLLLGYGLPLPRLPERVFFFEHRSEFEEMVQLAMKDELPPGITQCQADMAYELPESYEHLTKRCVFVYDGPVVEFTPVRGWFPVVYVDKQGHLNGLSSCIRGGIWEQLDEQWYICTDYDD